MKNRYEKLFLARKSAHLSVRDMAEKLEITSAYYWQIENKKRRLFYDLAVRIAKIFNMNPDDLFYEET